MASEPPPPPYTALANSSSGSNFQQQLQPPPNRRSAPRYHHKKNGCTCLKCICWCYFFLVLIVLVFAGLLLYFFIFYRPKVPSYNVSGFEVKAFESQPDFSLLTEFLVTVKADNPNSGMGFFYREDNYVIATYKDTELCRGHIPSFYQPHENVTMIEILLKGKSEFGGGIQEAYTDSQKSGKIPLLVKVKVPVNVVILGIELRRFEVLVTCSLVVDKLEPNQKIKILSNSCAYDVDFS